MSKTVMYLHNDKLGDLQPISVICLNNLIQEFIINLFNEDDAYNILEGLKIITIGKSVRLSITLPIAAYLYGELKKIAFTSKYETHRIIKTLTEQMQKDTNPYISMLSKSARCADIELNNDDVRNC